MGNWVDLHLHSKFSRDGSFSPEELARRCCVARLRMIALADHNTAAGVPAMMAAGKRLGLEVIPAVELDCCFRGKNIHVLGYGICAEAPEMTAHTEAIRQMERQVSEQRMDAVLALGIRFSKSWVRNASVDGIVESEGIVAAALADQRNHGLALLEPYRPGGSRSDNPLVNFHWDFCAQGKPAYVPVEYPQLETAVWLIHTLGGTAVLAHPGVQHLTAWEIGQIRDCGVEGVEAYSSYHTPQQMDAYRKIAEDLGMFFTMGSDYHGEIKPAVKLAVFPTVFQDEIARTLRRHLCV